MINVAVLGATGYTGLELCRLLMKHPNCQITHLFANRNAGQIFSSIYPQFNGQLDLELQSFDPEAIPSDIDVLFLAIPHAMSHAYMHHLIKTKIKIIDLSADFRLEDAATFNTYYNVDHQNSDLLSAFVYGVPELFEEQIQKSDYVANPGCYATSAILGLYPLNNQKLTQGKVIIDSKSGVSGAGRGLKETSLFCEANDNILAYGTGTHRHTAEIEEITGAKILFSPHLVPMNRGILSSIYVTLSAPKTIADIQKIYQDTYQNSPHIRLHNAPPSTKYVKHTNDCWISFKLIDDQTLVVFSAIDNLMKGAAGQAIQNMNVMMRIPQTTALTDITSYL